MQFFITGGAGFIGSNLIAHLNSLGHEDIYILEKPSWPKKWKNLVGLKYRDALDAPFYNDYRGWAKLFEKYIQLESVFINLGANSATTAVSDLETYHANVTLPRYLIKICESYNVRFVQASSAAVYGAEEINFQERVDGLKPTNFYGWTKLEVDKCIDMHKNDAFFKKNVFSLRFFNVYGPRENYKRGMCSVIHKWINQGIDGGNHYPVELFKSDRANYKDGEQSRDFVYVEDVCKIIYHCATVREEDKLGGIYNVGSGESTLYNSVISYVSSVLDWRPDIQYIDMPPLVKQHYQYKTRADLIKLRTKLNYQEKMTLLREGIEKTYKYITEN